MRITLLIFFLFINCDKSKTIESGYLESEPAVRNAVQLIEIAVLTNNNEGYYKSLSTTVFRDGKIAVYDKGNVKIHIYSPDGDEITSGLDPLKWTDDKFFE